LSSPYDLAFRVFGPAGPPWPGATHENHPVWLPVCEGRAQSFVAESNRVERVALYLARPDDPQAPLPPHTVTLEGNGRAMPDRQPLAQAALDPGAIVAEGWLEIALAADVQPGRTCWITLRPNDGSLSQLRLGAADDGSFPGGQCLSYESWGGYFDNWRTYDTSQLGIGHWPASYRLRLAVEALISPPKLAIESLGSQARISWNRGGRLEAAHSLSGAWLPLENAQTGVLVPTTGPAEFFRVAR